MEAGTQQRAAVWATIVIAATAVATLLAGLVNYQRNADIQLQLLALGTLQRYLDLAVAHPDLASHGADQPIDARYGWFAADALVTAQTLRSLVGQEGEWRRAIDAIVRHHRSYLRSGAFECDDFAPEFVAYLREKVADLKCAATGAAP